MQIAPLYSLREISLVSARILCENCRSELGQTFHPPSNFSRTSSPFQIPSKLVLRSKRSWAELWAKLCWSLSEQLCQSSSKAASKFKQSFQQICAEVQAKLSWSLSLIISKFERSSSYVVAKLSRSLTEVVLKFDWSYFARFASKWKHNFRAYCTYILVLQHPYTIYWCICCSLCFV